MLKLDELSMNIIFVGKRHGRSKTYNFGSSAVLLFVAALFVLALLAGVSGYFLSKQLYALNASESVLAPDTIKRWRQQVTDQRQALQDVDQATQARLDALTLRLGNMQAKLLRLDALGQRLTKVAKIKGEEFDFKSEPALGGPEEPAIVASYSERELRDELARLEQQLAHRAQQLDLLEEMFDSRDLQKELFIAGRPITWGWMSSAYGYRSDPFSGKRAWHAGVDFAGKDGSDIIAVAAGVVTWSGKRHGYGNLVEINHGRGYSTRYAHCKTLDVEVGAIVEKGQVVAKMGSTGRSTGPHVHFEVLKDGKTLDPEKFIHRASR